MPSQSQPMYQQIGYTNFNPTQQGGMPYSSGQFSDYHHGPHQLPTMGGAYSQLQGQPGPYTESTADQ